MIGRSLAREVCDLGKKVEDGDWISHAGYDHSGERYTVRYGYHDKFSHTMFINHQYAIYSRLIYSCTTQTNRLRSCLTLCRPFGKVSSP